MNKQFKPIKILINQNLKSQSWIEKKFFVILLWKFFILQNPPTPHYLSQKHIFSIELWYIPQNNVFFSSWLQKISQH